MNKEVAIRVVIGWIQEENGETSHAFKLEDAAADAYDVSADREFLAKQLGVTVSEVGVTSLILPLPQSLVARIKAEDTKKPDPSKGINGIESMIQSLRGMAKASSENNLIAAIMGYHMYDEDEEYPSRHGLDETHVARLSKLLSEISPSAEADPRFSSYDYADALLHTIYDIDPKKLIALGSDDFHKFAALMNEVAAEKRAVYEGSGFDDTTLLKLIEETGVKPDDQGPDEAEL